MSYRIGPNTEVEQGVVGGQPSRCFEEANNSFKQGKNRMYNPSIGVTLYYLLYVYDCAFTYRSLMETTCIMNLLTIIPCLTPRWI
jgi:hypothetical protein